MAVFLLLLLSASSLFSASFDEVVSLALTASPDAEAAELNHEAMLLDIMGAELDGYIFADEPTGALDSVTGHEVMDLFHRLNGEGRTAVFVTHDNSLASECSRMVRIRDGRIWDDC